MTGKYTHALKIQTEEEVEIEKKMSMNSSTIVQLQKLRLIVTCSSGKTSSVVANSNILLH